MSQYGRRNELCATRPNHICRKSYNQVVENCTIVSRYVWRVFPNSRSKKNIGCPPIISSLLSFRRKKRRKKILALKTMSLPSFNRLIFVLRIIFWKAAAFRYLPDISAFPGAISLSSSRQAIGPSAKANHKRFSRCQNK